MALLLLLLLLLLTCITYKLQCCNVVHVAWTGHVLPTTECEQDEQYDNHIESQVDNGKATKVRETPI